jgi:lauroyl/myristoyl acyltransferase
MDRLAYVLVWTLIKFLQALPLPVVARLGRCAGELAFWLDKRHRRVALENFRNAFAHERSPAEIQTLAREQFRRLGENYCASAKTASMSAEQLMPHLELVGTEHIQSAGPPSASRIIAIGHFGNFELYARANRDLPQFILATTYRALNQPRLNQLLIRLRTQHGCLVFERRRDALSRQPLVLGLLSDQHAGRRGIWMPFLGRMCSTNPAPAIYALRYRLPLLVAICYRTSLAQWRIEISPPIPTMEQGRRRSVSVLMAEINAAFEKAVRRDPPNWFWVHTRWRPQRK